MRPAYHGISVVHRFQIWRSPFIPTVSQVPPIRGSAGLDWRSAGDVGTTQNTHRGERSGHGYAPDPVLQQNNSHTVVGHADGWQELGTALVDLDPTVVVLDLDAPGEGMITAIDFAKAQGYPTAFVGLAGSNEGDEALLAVMDGTILKSDPRDRMPASLLVIQDRGAKKRAEKPVMPTPASQSAWDTVPRQSSQPRLSYSRLFRSQPGDISLRQLVPGTPRTAGCSTAGLGMPAHCRAAARISRTASCFAASLGAHSQSRRHSPLPLPRAKTGQLHSPRRFRETVGQIRRPAARECVSRSRKPPSTQCPWHRLHRRSLPNLVNSIAMRYLPSTPLLSRSQGTCLRPWDLPIWSYPHFPVSDLLARSKVHWKRLRGFAVSG